MHIITYKLSPPPSVDMFYRRSLLLSRAEIVPRLSSVSISRVPYLIIHTKITMECRSKLQNTGDPQKHTSQAHIVLQCCAVRNRHGKRLTTRRNRWFHNLILSCPILSLISINYTAKEISKSESHVQCYTDAITHQLIIVHMFFLFIACQS